ncbi:MAG: sulfatase [Acidobacteriota bacterium]
MRWAPIWFACLATYLLGCGDPRLPETIEQRLFVDDLLASAEAIATVDGRDVGAKYGAHARTVLTVPASATLVYDARITRQGDAGEIGPVEILVRADGEELVRRTLEADERFLIADGRVSLDELAGREVTIEFLADLSQRREGTGFYWHRLLLERTERVTRRPAGQGRNLLFVVVDTLRADHTSLDGYERPTTPRLDALAKTSQVFDRAFAPASWTLPSTVTLLTGLTPPAHGVVGGGHHLAYRFETLAERLQAGGITTFAASANPLIGPNLSFDQGFETFAHQPWERADTIQRTFLDWLDGAAEHRWFAYLHYIDPHDPYDAPPPGDRWIDPDYDGAFTDPTLLNQLYHTINWDLEPPRTVDERDLQYLRDAYDGEILYWDTRFGELLDALDARGVLDDTIVVVTSDHGEEFLEHGRIKHGHQLFDESLRVPLLIHAPGMVEPGRRDDPVSLDGLYRSLLQLMRMGPPARDDDLLRPPTDRQVFGHTRVPVAPDDPRNRTTVASIRDSGWWLVYEEAFDRQRLYDADADPDQRHDMAGEQVEIARRLRSTLDAWLAESASGDAPTTPAEVDPEALEQLRALGYIQ